MDWDRYAYARNNPEKYVDPNGHFPLLPLLGILIFLATLPGDTGPYEVDPTAAAIGNAGLRMVDPVDWVFTGIECANGNCSSTDIVLGLLPGVNGGLDDAADAVMAIKSSQIVGKWIRRMEHMSDTARAFGFYHAGVGWLVVGFSL